MGLKRIEGKAFTIEISIDGQSRYGGYDGEQCGLRLHNSIFAFIEKAEVGREMSISIKREPDVEAP